MQLDFRRLLQTESGRVVISILIGLGLATLFRKICTDGSCIDFHGVMVGEIQDKTFQHDDRCYQYQPVSSKCNAAVKKIVDVHDAGPEGEATVESFSEPTYKTD